MKKIFKSKNLVTVLALVVLVIVLFVFYSKRVNDALNPVTIPYAKKQIAAGSPITKDKVGTISISSSLIDDTVISLQSDVIGKYASADTAIPEGSLFYERQVVEKESLPANIILDVPKGYVLYYMNVDMTTSYGNAIYPGNYIDVYFKASVKSLTGAQSTTFNRVVYGRLLKNIKIITVKDSVGKPVFDSLDESRTPSMIVFAVPEEYYILLKKAEYLRTYSTELVAVPTKESLKNEPGELELSSKEIKDWINNVTIWTAS